MDLDHSPLHSQPSTPPRLDLYTTSPSGHFSPLLKSSPINQLKRKRSSTVLLSDHSYILDSVVQEENSQVAESSFLTEQKPFISSSSDSINDSGVVSDTNSSSKIQIIKRQKDKRMNDPRPTFVSSFVSSFKFDPGDRLPIFVYVPGSSISIKVTASQLLRQSQGPKVFAFFGDENDRYIHVLSDMAEDLKRNYNATIYAVSVSAPRLENPYGIPLVMDPKTVLTRYCRALHPNAGGRHAMNVIVIVDGFGKKRCFLPIGYGGYISRPVPVENLNWIINDTVRYIRNEQIAMVSDRSVIESKG
ncbi:hypothetical protein V1511DRAFT_455022 [Dipodascopsis uninucleata]